LDISFKREELTMAENIVCEKSISEFFIGEIMAVSTQPGSIETTLTPKGKSSLLITAL
jgi:hypothetical protein